MARTRKLSMRAARRSPAGVWALAAIASLVGCVHTYQVSRPVASVSGSPLDRSAAAYLARPENGTFENAVYDQSAQDTVSALAEAFGQRLARVAIADSVETYEQAIESARAGGFRYLIFPEIKHWEERATEWSGRPDRIHVRISVFNAGSGEILDAVDLQGKSRWATWGGDHPQDLLTEPVEQYVTGLFGAS